ncbi:putative exosome complex component RRP42 [Paratrimastix pyriformis]|uniref:Ribosomal RNA-processing protein 42 n=1 Tax=Paratrimastix pyriformis TaxID=342808 RepID=A0ABQ8URE8_9EUKA|nr:putative exosome complex component RRP42 [Paratrimastix pyriformis]
MLSAGERSFIEDGIAAGIRVDGRAPFTFREMTLEVDVLPQANGSARLQLGSRTSKTNVLVGVKAELGRYLSKAESAAATVEQDDSDERPVASQLGGRIDVTVQCTAGVHISDPMLWSHSSQSPEAVAAPEPAATSGVDGAADADASAGATQLGATQGGGEGTLTSEETEQLLSQRLTTLLNTGGAYKSLLEVVPAQYYWILHVDALVFEDNGNLLDALALATRAALHNTRVPRLKSTEGPTGEAELEVPEGTLADDDAQNIRIPIEPCPTFITFNRVGPAASGNPLQGFIVDALPAEERCSSVRLCVGITSGGVTSTTLKEGPASLSGQVLIELLDRARASGSALLGAFDQALARLERRRAAAVRCAMEGSFAPPPEEAESTVPEGPLTEGEEISRTVLPLLNVTPAAAASA